MITDETWALIAPRRSGRRRPAVAASIVTVMTLLAITAWWSGAAVPRLSATPTLVERGASTGRVRLHVSLRNEGLIQARPSSISSGTTLPVRGIEPLSPGGQEGKTTAFPEFSGNGWTLPAGASRPLVLELDVPCGSTTGLWDLEMVVYGPLSGYVVRVSWKEGPLPRWRGTVVRTACA